MPMKWTPENNELLLYKILETSSVTADVKAISESWPTDRGEVPTPRAITERLCKIRTNVKANGGTHFSVKAAKRGNDTTAAAPSAPGSTPGSTPSSTPRKPRAKKADTVNNADTVKKADTVTIPSRKKRKHTDEDVVVKREESVKEEFYLDGISDPSGPLLYQGEGEARWHPMPMKDEIKVHRAATYAHGIWNIIDAVDSDAEPGNVTDENLVPEPEEECV